MSWEKRFFGTAPAALTAQVEGRAVWARFPALTSTSDGPFNAQDLRVLDFRFLHGVAGPDGPGLLLSFTLRGATQEGSFVVFEPLFGQALLPAKLPTFQGPQGSIVVANDVYGGDRHWTTKVFLPFAAIDEVGASEMNCRFRLYGVDGEPLITFTKPVPWPDPEFRDAMNAMSFAVHLLVSLIRASGQLTPLDIQTIRRDLKRRHALSPVGLDILKRYLKTANKDPSTAQELGLLAREGKIFAPSDHEEIIEKLVGFAQVSGDISPKQQRYIQEFAHHAGFRTPNPFEFEEGEPQQAPYIDLPDSKLSAAYRCLGIASTASPEEIKKRYRHLVLEVHPDRLQHASEEVQSLANERLADINQAYECIQENLARF